MDKIEQWEKWFRRVSCLLSGLAALGIEHWFREGMEAHIGVSWLCAILAFLGLVELADFLFEKIINVRWIRRIILGRQWIEGTWFDVVVDKESKNIINAGIIKITSEDSILSISGDIYSPHGRHVGGFNSVLVKREGGKVEFIFCRDGLDKDTPEYGHATYTFSHPLHGEVSRYTGSFYDQKEKKVLHTDAEKVTDLRSCLLGTNSDEIKKEVARRCQSNPMVIT